MKICPMYEWDCPYFVKETDNSAMNFQGYCMLKQPEKDCDDYASVMEE